MRPDTAQDLAPVPERLFTAIGEILSPVNIVKLWRSIAQWNYTWPMAVSDPPTQNREIDRCLSKLTAGFLSRHATTPPLRRVAMRRLTWTTLVLVAACGGGRDTSTAPKQIAGTYNLATINGAAPPVPVYYDIAGNLTEEIIAASYTVNANGTFSDFATVRVTENRTVTTRSETCAGTFTQNGNTLSFAEAPSGTACGNTYAAIWDGNNALTVALNATQQEVFRR